MIKALPVIEVIPKNNEFYNYKNKYRKNLTDEICPADIAVNLTEELKQTAEKNTYNSSLEVLFKN